MDTNLIETVDALMLDLEGVYRNFLIEENLDDTPQNKAGFYTAIRDEVKNDPAESLMKSMLLLKIQVVISISTIQLMRSVSAILN